MRPLTHRPPRSFAKYALFVITVGLVAALATIGAAGTAGIAGAQEATCPPLDTGQQPGGNQTSITITAPEGQVIVQVCLKAGSAQQGEGPEFFNFDPGVTTVTLSHSSGKEISHFSVNFEAAPPPPTNGPPPTKAVPAPPGPGPAAAPAPRPPAAAPAPAPPRAPSAAAPVRAVPSVTG